MIIGDISILVLELVLLIVVYLYILNRLIPNYFGNVNKKIEAQNIKKAKNNLNLFMASLFLYMILEFLGYKAYILHIVASVVMMLLVANMIRPFSLKKWGKESFRLDEITDTKLIDELMSQKDDKNKFEYNNQIYFYRGEKFLKQIPTKKPTSKSEFWTGFFAVMIWAFLVINLVYILKVEMNAPEIMVTLLAFIIAYVLSPFYPDLYTTFVFAQDEEVDFEKFVNIQIGNKEYFGSIEKLTFFKIAIKDYYDDTIVTFFHKLFLNAVMTSYPNGRFIQKTFVVSTKQEQDEFIELLKDSLASYKEEKKETFEQELISKFDHNYGYGVKLRIKVKPEKLKEFGILKDQLETYIVDITNAKDLDLRTPVLEVNMQG